MDDLSAGENQSFGAYVRMAREAASPPSGLTRRAVGLAANISEAYVKRIENEDLVPSRPVLGALADALMLDGHQRAHLFLLANYADEPGALLDVVTPSDRLFVDALVDTPAAFLDASWNILYANSAYGSVFPGLLEEGNVLRWFFLNDHSRTVMVDWEDEAALTVDWLRHRMVRVEHRPAASLLSELRLSPDFDRLWRQRGVVVHRRRDSMRLLSAERGRMHHLNVRLFPVSEVSSNLCFIATRTDTETLPADRGPE